MNLMEMVTDYCLRTKSRRTPAEIAFIISRNLIICNENGFVVFAHVLDEFHALFAYAAPGKSFAPILAEIEQLARDNGIKCIKYSTDRPQTMGRLFRGYKPFATVMRREMN